MEGPFDPQQPAPDAGAPQAAGHDDDLHALLERLLGQGDVRPVGTGSALSAISTLMSPTSRSVVPMEAELLSVFVSVPPYETLAPVMMMPGLEAFTFTVTVAVPPAAKSRPVQCTLRLSNEHAMPTPSRRNPPATTMRPRSDQSAPCAERIPISRIRRLTP